MFLFSKIFCAIDSISLNKRDCLFFDQYKANYELISFEYDEGYYRAIHLNYGVWNNESVKMKYLGDSSKDIFMNCYIGPNYITSNTGGIFHYHIPCALSNAGLLKKGTYCIEIVKKLVGDIDSESFCTDYYSFKVTKSTSIPTLTVVGFDSEQKACVYQGETITLIAKVKNKMSISQDFAKIGIALSNTESVGDDIALLCKIDGEKSVFLK